MDVDANIEKKEQDLKTGGKNMWYGYKIKSKCRELGERLLQTLKDDSGVGVVEVILILVGIFTPYYGVSIKCIT